MGIEDAFAGDSGKFEWRDNKDILKRSFECITKSKANGFCIFTYSSFYDPLSGDGNKNTDEERTAFCDIIKSRAAQALGSKGQFYENTVYLKRGMPYFAVVDINAVLVSKIDKPQANI